MLQRRDVVNSHSQIDAPRVQRDSFHPPEAVNFLQSGGWTRHVRHAFEYAGHSVSLSRMSSKYSAASAASPRVIETAATRSVSAVRIIPLNSGR